MGKPAKVLSAGSCAWLSLGRSLGCELADRLGDLSVSPYVVTYCWQVFFFMGYWGRHPGPMNARHVLLLSYTQPCFQSLKAPFLSCLLSSLQ